MTTRPNADNNAFAKRMTERPIGKSMTEPYHDDPPSRIGYAMGGREWFFETEARALHRIGIFLGLGWRLPKYVQRPDGIDMVRIVVNPVNGALDIQFLHCGDRPPEEAEPIRGVGGLAYADLRETYERELNA